MRDDNSKSERERERERERGKERDVLPEGTSGILSYTIVSALMVSQQSQKVTDVSPMLNANSARHQ